ncbi:MAG: hypothetical protein ACLBM1_03390, partial [Cuspidothrix sp.]
ALSQELNTQEISLESSTSFYPKLEKQSLGENPSVREFWLGTKRLPQIVEVPTSSGVSAILIKKQGDFPAFWHKNNSFVETMDELYQRVKTKNQNLI